MNDLDAALRATYQARSHTPEPPSLLDEVLAIPDLDIPQQRLWLPLPTGRFRSMFTATQFVVGGLVIAIFGGVLLTGIQSGQHNEQAAPAALTASASPATTAEVTSAVDATSTTDAVPVPDAIALPDELPEGARGGSIDTVLGPIDWVHLADPELVGTVSGVGLPQFVELQTWGEELAVWGWGRGEMELWRTADGLRWEAVPLPPLGDEFDLSIVGDMAVLTSIRDFDAPRVWVRTPDTGAWDELDTSAMPDALPSWSWGPPEARREDLSGPHLRPFPVLPDAGRDVILINAEYRLPRARLDIDPGPKFKKMRRLEPDLYALCGKGSCPTVGSNAEWRLRFKETGKGLRVTNERTGKQLGIIHGARLSELYEGDEAETMHAFAIEGEAVVPIDLPSIPERPYFVDQLPGPPDELTPPMDQARALRGAPHSAHPWLSEFQQDDGSKHVMAWIGDDWVSLDELALPTDVRIFSAGRIGDLVVLSASWDGHPHRDIWLLELPEGA